jgi:Zn-dependent protease
LQEASRGAIDSLTATFEAWRSHAIGRREYTEALVSPAHRGPSPALARALAAWPGRYYWADADHAHLVLIRSIGTKQGERWLLHVILFAVTVICALGAGATLAGTWTPTEPPGLVGVLIGGARFFERLAGPGWRDLVAGWSFAVPLLGILLVHELGHYFAARRYGIDASPPYFLPVPPNLSPIGSLGAYIRLRSPVLDRRQLLEVGAAGPLAGFALTLLVLVWGLSISEPMEPGLHPIGSFVLLAGERIELGDSLLMIACRKLLLPGAQTVHLSLPAFAGWVGAFVTGLNLLPLSQLDGGHVLYGLLGRRQSAVGLITLLVLIGLAQLSWNWYVWVAVALFVGGGGWAHPSVLAPARPVPPSRRWIGWVSVVVFVLTFVPVPFGS